MGESHTKGVLSDGTMAQRLVAQVRDDGTSEGLAVFVFSIRAKEVVECSKSGCAKNSASDSSRFEIRFTRRPIDSGVSAERSESER